MIFLNKRVSPVGHRPCDTVSSTPWVHDLEGEKHSVSSAAFHAHAEYAININKLLKLVSGFLLSLLQIWPVEMVFLFQRSLPLWGSQLLALQW